MKRVFLSLSLLIGVMLSLHAQIPDPCPEYSGNSELPDKCAECLLDPGDLRVFKLGGCQYGFILWDQPELFPDSECSGLSITYAWDFDDGSLPIGPPAAHWQTYTFTSNGTYDVCVAVIIEDGSGEDVCCYQLCEEVVVDCVRCDILDCDGVDVQAVGYDNIKFTFPLTNCEDCPHPEYRIGWKEKYASGGWDYSTGITIDNGNEVGIADLDTCKEYLVIIEVWCDGLEGTLSDFCTFDFQTLGCDIDCDLDCEEVMIKGVSYREMRFTFLTAVGNCPNCPNAYYNIGWRLAGSTGPWNYGGTSVGFPSVPPPAVVAEGSIFSLDPCTDYEFIIELKCPGSAPYPWQTPTIDSCVGEFSTLCPLLGAPPVAPKPALPGYTLTMAYPNPAGNTVNIVVMADREVEGVIRIYNSLGVVVRQVSSQTQTTREINIDDLPAGTYHYTFTAESATELRADGKFVILK